MKISILPLIMFVALAFGCTGKNADGTPNISNADTSHTGKPLTRDSTAKAPKDAAHQKEQHIR